MWFIILLIAAHIVGAILRPKYEKMYQRFLDKSGIRK